MNCEFQILYAAAGKVESINVIARSEAAARLRIAEVGVRSAELNVQFVRFVPNGLPGDGLDLQQFADYLGDSIRTARRALGKVDHIKCGARVSITVPALEQFERVYTVLAGRNSTQRRNGSKAQCRSVGRRLFRSAA